MGVKDGMKSRDYNVTVNSSQTVVEAVTMMQTQGPHVLETNTNAIFDGKQQHACLHPPLEDVITVFCLLLL